MSESQLPFNDQGIRFDPQPWSPSYVMEASWGPSAAVLIFSTPSLSGWMSPDLRSSPVFSNHGMAALRSQLKASWAIDAAVGGSNHWVDVIQLFQSALNSPEAMSGQCLGSSTSGRWEGCSV